MLTPYEEIRMQMYTQIFERVRDHLGELPELEAVIIARESEEERNNPRVHSLESFIGEPSDWPSLENKGLDVTAAFREATPARERAETIAQKSD